MDGALFLKLPRVGRPREPIIKAMASTTTSVSLKWDALDRRSAAYAGHRVKRPALDV